MNQSLEHYTPLGLSFHNLLGRETSLDEIEDVERI